MRFRREKITLNDNQIVTLEKKKHDDATYIYPSYFGSQDMFYLGDSKGIRHIY